MRWWTKSLQTSVWASKGDLIMTDIAILAAALLGLLFPWQLVAAIRTPDPDRAEHYCIRACILFGGLVLLSLMVVRS